MKNDRFKLALIAWMGIALSLAMTSCSDDEEITLAWPEGAQVFFPNDLPSKISMDVAGTRYEIPIMRAVTGDAITVPLTVVNENGIISVATSASFAAGESKSSVVVNYSFDDLGYENYQNIKITIDPEYTTPYGNAYCSLSLGVSAPWVLLGNGQFYDDNVFGGYNYCVAVTVEQREDDLTQYRISNPYTLEAIGNSWVPEYTDYGYSYPATSQDYITFTITEDGDMSWNAWYTNFAYDGGDVTVAASADYEDSVGYVEYNADGSIESCALCTHPMDPEYGDWGAYWVYIAFPGYDMAADWGYDLIE